MARFPWILTTVGAVALVAGTTAVHADAATNEAPRPNKVSVDLMAYHSNIMGCEVNLFFDTGREDAGERQFMINSKESCADNSPRLWSLLPKGNRLTFDNYTASAESLWNQARTITIQGCHVTIGGGTGDLDAILATANAPADYLCTAGTYDSYRWGNLEKTLHP